MITTETMSLMENDDAGLVAHSLRGDREAFSEIVARYQNLMCSLAYSATGSLTQSEDLAQETFTTAWRQLGELREPAKLRSWLCGILRNLSRRNRRGQQHEPVYGAETLENAAELPALEAHPRDQAITREEAAILWRSLERLPETYREPLILLYREHESVERVAQMLDLSEDNVRQRLVRGRKMLHDEVLAFVEGTLARTSPGRAFTLGVVASLPAATSTAKAATTGVTLAKGAVAVKGIITAGSVGGVLGMLGGAWITMRAQADDTKSPRERQFMHQMVGLRVLAGLLFFIVAYGLNHFDPARSYLALDIERAALVFASALITQGIQACISRRQRRIQIEEKTFVADEWLLPRKTTEAAALAAGKPAGTWRKTVQFMAFGLIISVILIGQVPWQAHLSRALFMAVCWVSILYLSYRGWRSRPRYQSLQSWRMLLGPVVLALLTLLLVDRHFGVHNLPGQPPEISPQILLVFNSVIVAAYAVFIALLFWFRRQEARVIAEAA